MKHIKCSTALLAGVALLLAAQSQAQIGQTVNWIGGNSYQSWFAPANWDKNMVPTNGNGTNFTVIVPDGTSLTYDGGGAGTIDALSFGNSTLRVRDGSELLVTSATVIKGIIDAQGAGSGFHATANQSVLQNYPRLWAADGGRIGIRASSYAWANAGWGNYTLLSASGDSSRLDLTNVTALTVNYGDSGSWVYSVDAKLNGVIDLSRLGQITGPGSDDWLDFNLETGGTVLLRTNLATAGRVRFNVNVPDYEIPHLGQASETYFNLASGRTLRLPSLLALSSGGFSLGTDATVFAPSLTSVSSSYFALETNATLIATNLVSYRYSGLNILPGRNYQLGPMHDIYSAWLAVSGGTTLRVAATSYGTPDNWYWYGTLFSADGTGSLLDLSSVGAMDIRYSAYAGYDYRYMVTANNGGIIDLSGLQSLAGPQYDNRYLEFNIRNGGNIWLTSLKQLSRYQSFNIEVPQYTLPALETADSSTFSVGTGNRLSLPQAQRLTNTRFNLADGARADMPLATSLAGSSFSWGFNSTVNAPAATDFAYGSLGLAPGRIFNGLPFENIYAARLSVSGGTRLRVAATSYGTPDNWYWYGTLFSADGTGSLLDLSSLNSMDVRYSAYAGYDYRYMVTANNGGVVDLSGLQSLAGPQYDNRYLEFTIRNGGDIRLTNLRQLNRYQSFNIEVPHYTLPALETADTSTFNVGTGNRLSLPQAQRLTNTRFNLADGARADMPLATSLAGSSFSWGFNSTINAPAATDFAYGSLGLAPGRIFNGIPFENIYGARLAVSGGATLRVAATSYGTPDNWYWYGTLFSADGTGSLLDLSSVTSMDIRYSAYAWYDYRYMVTANNSGVIDLSGLQSLAGPQYDNRYLEFNASNSGKLRFGNLSVSRYQNFNVAGLDSGMRFASLYFRSPANLSVSTHGLLNLKGDLLYENTDPNSMVVENAYFQMDGARPQRLEVGGRDSGPSGFTSRNFGYSQLIVGSTNQTSVVRLVDTINNGGRGAGGEPEALYLYGMDGAGLRILNGSRLVLNGVNAYTAVGGQMMSLRSLIPGGTNSVAFDGGWLANSGGPRITNMTPSLAVTPVVSSVDVALDLPIQATSFTPADVSITGPGGSIPATGVSLVSGTTWRISFAPQSVDGSYTVRVGPSINELAANLTGLDQNQDGLSGDGTNDTFVGTFVIDGTAPLIASALALNYGTRIGMTFNEAVVPATVTNAASYAVNGSQPLAVALQPDGKSVALVVPALVGDSFDLSVTGVADALGNTTNRTFTGTILARDSRDVGATGSNPQYAGSVLTFRGDDYALNAGGSDFYWNGSDAGHFAPAVCQGDFDVRVQIADMSVAETYTQAGLMWRESLASDARRLYVCINHPSYYNNCWALIRWTPGAAGAEWPSYSRPGVGSFPNVWLRLKREGDLFTAFRSSDGTNWQQYATVTAAFARTGYVGPASTARNNGSLVTAWYQNYADLLPAIVTQPASQSVASGANVTFAVTVRGLPPLAYQWQLNGIPLPGETGNSLTLLAVNTNRVGNYRVVVSNAYGTNTSQEALLAVDGVGEGGFEADLSPAPLGNNVVTVSDWVKVGRLVAGLDVPLNSSEFRRGDCAPRTNALLGTLPLGDGRLSVADWTQAGRYAAAVDPLTAIGGPSGPVGGTPGVNGGVVAGGRTPKDGDAVRSIRLRGAKVAQGQTFFVPVELVALGGENALGFSVQFDPARLACQGVVLGEDAGGVTLQVNASQASGGAVGLVLAKSVGQAFGAGTSQVAQVQFKAIGPTGTQPVAFADSPVWREIADAGANVQPAVYAGGAVRVVAPGVLSSDVHFDGNTVELRLTGEPGERYRVEVSADLTQWSAVSTATAAAGPVAVRDPAGVGAQRRFYRAVLVP